MSLAKQLIDRVLEGEDPSKVLNEAFAYSDKVKSKRLITKEETGAKNDIPKGAKGLVEASVSSTSVSVSWQVPAETITVDSDAIEKWGN